MSQEAINFKKGNINLNYRNMSLAELNKLPPHNGVIEFKITTPTIISLVVTDISGREVSRLYDFVCQQFNK